jgi:hypothetical protein
MLSTGHTKSLGDFPLNCGFHSDQFTATHICAYTHNPFRLYRGIASTSTAIFGNYFIPAVYYPTSKMPTWFLTLVLASASGQTLTL